MILTITLCTAETLLGAFHIVNAEKISSNWRPGSITYCSSSGSAALVGGGVVDMALGTDQGGSVTQPAIAALSA